MIRDTFESNPGLCELFKRKILERAQSAGLRSDLIDFESQIDMKGTFKDNLQIFYREYPQLAQDSDYLRFKSPRPLTGVVVEQAWRSYERSNGRPEQPIGMEGIMPELTVTYTVDLQPPSAGKEVPKEARAISKKAVPSQGEANQTLWAHTELTKLILDRVTAMAAENVTKAILQQLERETERTAFYHPRNQEPPGNLIAALDHALKIRGPARAVDLYEKLADWYYSNGINGQPQVVPGESTVDATPSPSLEPVVHVTANSSVDTSISRDEKEISSQPSSASLMLFSDDCSKRVVPHRYCSQCGASLWEAVKKPHHSAAAIAFVAGLVHADRRLTENTRLK